MSESNVNGVEIEDTFAEAFGMKYSRILVTARDKTWLDTVCCSATGFATSVIGCGVEAGVEGYTDDTPDKRPGAFLLFFAMGKKALEEQLVTRIGQAIMTCPTTAVFNATESDTMMDIGAKLRYFGDGYQASKVVTGRRYWRIPVMDGEFVVEESFGRRDGVGGGNFIIMAESSGAALESARAAVGAMDAMPGVIMPFPGGVARSGSKVGSRYAFLKASTNSEYCPTIRRQVEVSMVGKGVNCVLEIVIDGVGEEPVKAAMKAGIHAACSVPGIKKVTAGNYGGNLGSFRFDLHLILKKA